MSNDDMGALGMLMLFIGLFVPFAIITFNDFHIPKNRKVFVYSWTIFWCAPVLFKIWLLFVL